MEYRQVSILKIWKMCFLQDEIEFALTELM